MANIYALRRERRQARIAQMLKAGETTRVIRAALGCRCEEIASVRYFLTYGVPRPKVPLWEERRSAQRARSEERAAEVMALLEQGLSYRKAAARLGVKPGVIAGLKHRARLRQMEAAR